MSSCCVCRVAVEPPDCQTIELTEAEKAAYPGTPDELFYCRPCWKILSDPVRGPVLVSGLVQQYLRRLGVSNAEQLAAKFESALAARAVRRS